MAYTLWSQDVFSKGELSPFMYARATVNQYGDGLKTATNVLTYPTGAAGKRFGTLYQSTLTGFTAYNQIYFDTFQYVNDCVYQLVFSPLLISIYLEGILVATVVTTLNANQVYNMSTTVLGALFRVATFGIAPYDLSRSANAANPIASTASNVLTVTGAALPVGVVLPIQFTTTGTLPVSVPQVVIGVTYFVFTQSSTTVTVYLTPQDAKAQTNQITFSTAGTTSNIVVSNTWTFAKTIFKNVPVYDFNGVVTSYDAITFTPSTVTGSNIQVLLSAPYAPLTATGLLTYVGGAFIGGGGTSRIIQVIDTTHIRVSVQVPFDSLDAIQGSLAFLAEPAWSDARGWPQVCSSYQNRALFANNVSLPNGFWASVINDYTDFSDLTGDDDDAISWYPTSNNVNYIRFIVPYRSLTVHTNTGIYSSPLSDVSAITPSNFTLQLQDSTPADTLLPQAIDNQVVVLSGNDAHQMLWDGINNAYTSDIVSVISEQLIRTPVDEVGFADLKRAGSRYIFIINFDGSMAIFQTLISQNVSGFTPAIMEQTYGDASFLQAASSAEGRCWFVCQREVASAVSPIAITAFTSLTLHATGSNFSLTMPTAITFTTTGTLPASTPQLIVDNYYWAVGIDADNFNVFLDQADALAATNPVTFTSAGTNSNVIGWPLTTIYTLEELTQDTYLDCAIFYDGTPVSTIPTGVLFNAQSVKMVGDGFGFDAIGIDNQVIFEAHGVVTTVSEAYIGFPINTVMQPMPLTIATGNNAKTTSLTKPKHIREVRFMFNDTIGGEINGVPIAISPFNQVPVGEPPIPANGIVLVSPMGGWDDFNNPTYTITHSDPFNIELLGVFYSVDI
jgi:hypothetical protein